VVSACRPTICLKVDMFGSLRRKFTFRMILRANSDSPVHLRNINLLIFAVEMDFFLCRKENEFWQFLTLNPYFKPPKPDCDPRLVHVRFMVDKMAMGKLSQECFILLQSESFYHSLTANVTRWRGQRRLGGIQQWNIFQDGRSLAGKVLLFYYGEDRADMLPRKVVNYQSTLRNISEEGRLHIHCCGSFKSRIARLRILF
jgi:hypothetical protein